MNKKEKIEIIEHAFRSGIGHSRCQCVCGNMFYNSNGGWDWEDGELEELEKSNAINLDYTVDTIMLEGKEYCVDCDCWHDKALNIFAFLISHNHQIVDLFLDYKKYKQQEVDIIELPDKI